MEEYYIVENDWDKSVEYFGTLDECEKWVEDMKNFTTQNYTILAWEEKYSEPDFDHDLLDQF